MGIGSVVLRRLVVDWRRALATALLVLVAVTSFVVLTGTAERSRLNVVGTTSSATSAYDVLVRPHGSRSAIEQSTGLVRPNYLSGLFGGITLAQLQKIRGAEGVEVAAPIAMVGEVLQGQEVPIDVTPYVKKGGTTLLRFTTRQSFARGAASTAGPSGYLYVGQQVGLFERGDTLGFSDAVAGKQRLVCASLQPAETSNLTPYSPQMRFAPQCWDANAGSGGEGWPAGDGKFIVRVKIISPVMLAAVDPTAEDRLVGLGGATQGSALEPSSKPRTDVTEGFSEVKVPVVAASATSDDVTTAVTVDRLGTDAIARLQAKGSFGSAYATVTQAAGTPVLTRAITAEQAHRQWLNSTSSGAIFPRLLFRPSSVDYSGSPRGVLAPKPVKDDPLVWQTGSFTNEPFAQLPATAAGTGFRSITPVAAREGAPLTLQVQGTYDPKRLKEQSSLARVPMETYQSPEAVGADAATRAVLRGQSLKPDANPRGYLQGPPMLLTSLASLPVFADPANFNQPEDGSLAQRPLSAVRIKVRDADIGTPAGRERIRVVAEEIQRRTGLDVDVTAGSSPAPTTVALPASSLGQPAMKISEPWSRKGVAALVTTAVNKKSLMLFVLILASTALAVAMSANAAVRARRTELGVMSCIGWRRWTITREVLAELLLLGLLAGVAGAVLSVPIGAATDTPVTASRALLAVPVALLLVLVAGVWPALRAASITPGEAIRPFEGNRSRRRIPLRGTATMAASYLLRTPARVITAALSLALGVTSLAILVGVIHGFRGSVVGTVLGDAISVQVQGTDVIAGALLAIIGLASLADVIHLDIREQASNYASLRATGWRDRTLATLVAWQAAGIGAVGALLGIVLALAGLALLGALTPTTALITVGVGAAAVLAAVVVSLIPALALRRLPMATLLAQD